MHNRGEIEREIIKKSKISAILFKALIIVTVQVILCMMLHSLMMGLVT